MLCFEGVFEGVTTAEHRINDEKDEDAQPDSILSMPRVSFAFEDGCRMSGTGRMVDAMDEPDTRIRGTATIISFI